MLTANSTNVYNYISGCYFLASVLGSAIGSQLLYHHVYFLNGLSILCYLSTACLASFVPAYFGRDVPTPTISQPAVQGEYADASSAMLLPVPLDVSHSPKEVTLSPNLSS